MNYKKFLGAASVALMIVITVSLLFAPGAWAQNRFKTLHKFTGLKDGGLSAASLILDRAGNLYGTTAWGGGNGNVFKLTPKPDGTWKEKVLHSFCTFTDCSDGYALFGGLIFDQAGSLSGTAGGGGAYDQGVVFKLTPNLDESWTESVLYSFCTAVDCHDGLGPDAGLISDPAGNL
jgi:hypothetical protein